MAGDKRSFADRSITGGFFDGQTSPATRRQYLLDLLQDSARAQHAVAGSQHHLSDADISALLMRLPGDSPARLCMSCPSFDA